MNVRRLLVLGLGLCLLSRTVLGAPTAPTKGEILGEGTCWRYYVMRLPPAVTVASFQAAGQKADAPKVCQLFEKKRTSPPTPAGWFNPEFDDTEWPTTQRGVLNTDLTGMAHNFRACLRGRFRVSEPTAAGTLTLNLQYRGGAIVYLNGVEIARKNLPAGPLADDTPGDLYPNDAWVDADGKAISAKAPWPAVRDRSLDAVKFPTAALRKGVNVLAIELRRSPFHPVALKWNDNGFPPTFERWIPLAWLGVRLSGGAGVEPNAGRPAGFQAWVYDRNERATPQDYRDPNETPHPLHMVGARNGGAWGQIAVSSDKAIAGLTLRVGQIKHTNGRDTIAENRATVLYGTPATAAGDYSDELLDRPPATLDGRKGGGATVAPLLVRIDIPTNAVAGEYRTELTVSAAGQAETRIPVELYVADWRVPNTRDYRTFVSIYQSPETVAMQYKVPQWSEEHWKLLDKSWQLLGRVANKTVIVHAVEQTQFGNDRSTVYWIKKADGTYDWDFTVFDRYLNLAISRCGKPDHVALQICHVGNAFNSKGQGWAANPIDQQVTVTTKDPATGALGSLNAPLFNTDAARKFWKPYLAAVSAHLDKLGIKKTLCLGIFMDNAPPSELVQTFDAIWPDGDNTSRWMRGCHSATDKTKPYLAAQGAKGVVVLHEYCYGGGVKDAKLGEMRQFPGAYYFRNTIPETHLPLTLFRTFGDYCLYIHGPDLYTKGIGRICLDYWIMGKSDLYSRFPYSDCMQRRPDMCRLSWPGPDGALPTSRLEALIDGLQESEAVIVLSEALDQRRARMDPALVKRCVEALAARKQQAELAFGEFDNRSAGWAVPHPCHLGWKDIRRRLFDCAAEVSRLSK